MLDTSFISFLVGHHDEHFKLEFTTNLEVVQTRQFADKQMQVSVGLTKLGLRWI